MCKGLLVQYSEGEEIFFCLASGGGCGVHIMLF